MRRYYAYNALTREKNLENLPNVFITLGYFIYFSNNVYFLRLCRIILILNSTFGFVCILVHLYASMVVYVNLALRIIIMTIYKLIHIPNNINNTYLPIILLC